jgi:hypothetical protein
MHDFTRRIAAILIIAGLTELAACGGSGSDLPSDSLGGTVNGLEAGSTLVLQNNGGDNLAIGANGGFVFSASLAPGSMYEVTVSTQPAGETCTVNNASGQLPGTTSVLSEPAAHGVSDVVVNCSAGAGPFSVSGTVKGLLSGRNMVLQENGGNDTTVSADGSFAFSTRVARGTPYAVTILTQPAGQSCTIGAGSGAAILGNITNVSVLCSDDAYTVGAAVSGLTANASVVLQLNAGNNLTVSANGTMNFNTSIDSGSDYAITVLTQPAQETCTVADGSGTVIAANIVATVTCRGLSSFTIGGTVSGLLTGNSVVLQDNGGNATTLSANTAFTFGTALASGSTYAVTVLTQPSGQTCTVSNGDGTVATADVTNVAVTCTTASSAGQWTWESGSNQALAAASYGTKGVAAPSNVPGNRDEGATWTDSTGNFWLFGGDGYNPGGGGTVGGGALNDLWRYSPSTGLWTWISGSDLGNAPGVYGTLGTAAAANVPGAREYPVSWRDNAGNLWLFGGGTIDAGALNDLWRYNIATGLWTWESGSSTENAVGVYGAKGTPAPGNVPGARYSSMTWIDGNGNLWLLGGIDQNENLYNDLWRYDPSSGQWTWMSGSNVAEAAGIYGTKGTGAAANVPGAREAAATWTDTAGNLWLFGGDGIDSTGELGALNDLWHYNVGTGLWSWISGSNLKNAAAVYGTEGSAAAGNVPGARFYAASWIDSASNLWLFGGNAVNGIVNDLWHFSPSTGLWTWVSGPDTDNMHGVYGTLGVAAAANVPGSRADPVSWIDSTGNLWLFGGDGYDSVAGSLSSTLNDLWKYAP